METDLLVVFGAGASFDSVSSGDMAASVDHHYRPPLANGLFDNRPTFGEAVDRWSDVRPLAHSLRRTAERLAPKGSFDLEAELELVVGRSETGDPNARKQLLAVRFYIRDILTECANYWIHQSRGITNYIALIDHLERWRSHRDARILAVTFNYDSILREALRSYLGKEFHTLDAYVEDGPWLLFHLHGMTDWERVTTLSTNQADSRTVFDAPSSYVEEDDYVLRGYTGTGRITLPALAIPVTAKSNFICPPNHVSSLTALLPGVGRLLVVGWHGSENHFIEMLRIGLRKNIPALVVNQDVNGANVIAKRLHDARPDIQVEPSSLGGFSHLAADLSSLAGLLNQRSA
jgi:hypothetical protein